MCTTFMFLRLKQCITVTLILSRVLFHHCCLIFVQNTDIIVNNKKCTFKCNSTCDYSQYESLINL